MEVTVAPPYGVDAQISRLDFISWPAFRAWNGDEGPAFAGRNFLGGDFIRALPEATMALATPSPSDVTLLDTITDYIAPFQANGDSTPGTVRLRRFFHKAAERGRTAHEQERHESGRSRFECGRHAIPVRHGLHAQNGKIGGHSRITYCGY